MLNKTVVRLGSPPLTLIPLTSEIVVKTLEFQSYQFFSVSSKVEDVANPIIHFCFPDKPPSAKIKTDCPILY